MGILFLTVKQERCSDLLLWSAAWLLPLLRLMPMLMLTTAMATALDLATPVLATLVSAMPVLDMLVLDTLMARGRPRLSPRLMLTTAMDTALDTVVSDTATLVSATVLEPTELTEPTGDKFVQLSSRSSSQSLPSVLLFKE